MRRGVEFVKDNILEIRVFYFCSQLSSEKRYSLRINFKMIRKIVPKLQNYRRRSTFRQVMSSPSKCSLWRPFSPTLQPRSKKIMRLKKFRSIPYSLKANRSRSETKFWGASYHRSQTSIIRSTPFPYSLHIDTLTTIAGVLNTFQYISQFLVLAITLPLLSVHAQLQ